MCCHRLKNLQHNKNCFTRDNITFSVFIEELLKLIPQRMEKNLICATMFLLNGEHEYISSYRFENISCLCFFNLIIKNYWLVLSKKIDHYVTDKVLPCAL